MLTVEEIKRLIEADAASPQKRRARVGLRYYRGDHDIKGCKFFFFDAEDNLVEDTYKSNAKIAHRFFSVLTDQHVGHQLSMNGPMIRSDIPELQTELDAYFNENDTYERELSECIRDAIVQGSGFMYAYKNTEGRTTFQQADSQGIVEVRARETQDKADYVIYWYTDRMGTDGKDIQRIQVWNAKEVGFFCREGTDGAIVKDDGEKINPRPHSLYKEGDDETLYCEDYGFIPFFRLDNGKDRHSNVFAIKEIVDDYDMMNCGLTNNIQDSGEVLYIAKGINTSDEEQMKKLAWNLRTKKLLGLPDNPDAGFEIKTLDIPTEARKIKMDEDRRNIYHIGRGVDIEALRDTGATVSVAVKMAFDNLDKKCREFSRYLSCFLRKQVKVVLAEINEAQGTDYQMRDVYFNLTEWEGIVNALENAQIALTEAQEQQTRVTTWQNLAGTLGAKIVQQQICEAMELDYDDIKDKLPQPEEDANASAMEALKKIQPVEETGGGDVIA